MGLCGLNEAIPPHSFFDTLAPPARGFAQSSAIHSVRLMADGNHAGLPPRGLEKNAAESRKRVELAFVRNKNSAGTPVFLVFV